MRAWRWYNPARGGRPVPASHRHVEPERAARKMPAGLLIKAVYRAAFTGLTQPALLPLLRPWFRADHPWTALVQGERLVRRSRRVLALTAHEDDLEFFCGGTLRRIVDAGGRVTAAVLTDGEKGGNFTGLGSIRLGEERRAAARLGCHRVEFLHLTDYGFPEDPRLVPAVRQLIRRHRPDCLLAFEPRGEAPGFVNRDHTTLGKRVVELAPVLLGQGTEVYLYATRHPNTLVGIGPVMEQKLYAVLSHRSQLRYLERAEYIRLVRWFAQLFSPAPPLPVEPLYRLV